MNVYENHELKNKRLPFYFKKRVLGSNQSSLYANWHENIELLFFTKGSATVFDNAQRFQIEENGLFAIGANSLHSISANQSDVEYSYLIVDRSFCIENGFDTSQLSFDCVVNNDRIRELMNRLASEFTCADSLPFFTLRIRATVLEIMMELCIKHSKDVPDTENTSRSATCVKKAIAFIDGAFDRDLSLDEVAEFSGLDKFYLSHEFKKYTGQSFVTYLNQVRCTAAAALLRESNLSIAAIGEKCGFSNRSYFAKCFLSKMGMTPSEYRRQFASTAKG